MVWAEATIVSAATSSVWSTSTALYEASPAWLTRTTTVPAAVGVSTLPVSFAAPLTSVNVRGRPLEAVAARVTGEPATRRAGGTNAIVCEAAVIVCVPETLPVKPAAVTMAKTG